MRLRVSQACLGVYILHWSVVAVNLFCQLRPVNMVMNEISPKFRVAGLMLSSGTVGMHVGVFRCHDYQRTLHGVTYVAVAAALNASVSYASQRLKSSTRHDR